VEKDFDARLVAITVPVINAARAETRRWTVDTVDLLDEEEGWNLEQLWRPLHSRDG